MNANIRQRVVSKGNKCYTLLNHSLSLEKAMEYREIWGASFERITEFLSSLPQTEKCGSTCYRYGGATIIVRQLPDSLFGRLRLPRTEVYISGSDKDVSEVHNKLFWRFLSAGG